MCKLIFSAVSVAVVCLWSTANANSFNITMSLPLNGSSVLVGDVAAQDIPNGSGLGDAAVFSWLQSDVSTYNANLLKSLPAPLTTETAWDNINSGPLIKVAAGDYLVLHYGTGTGGFGAGDGGGLVALYFDAAGTYKVPDNGSGPNGYGGISFARVWGHSVPDGGSTLGFLGAALSGLSLFARRFRRSLC